MTHTYGLLSVSPATYAEIRAALVALGYPHAIHTHDGAEVLDMHGIALQAVSPVKTLPWVHWRTPTMTVACGSDEPGQTVTAVQAHVTCPSCLSDM